MQLINFWLVVLAFITAATVDALTDRRQAAASIISACGIAATFAFQRLERRTRQLVKASEEALAKLQHDLAVDAGCEELEMVRRVQKAAPLSSYGQVMLLLHAFAFAAFLMTAAYSLTQWLK
jgi:hypothetical protein